MKPPRMPRSAANRAGGFLLEGVTFGGGYFWKGLDVHSEITRNENYNHHDTNEVENIQFYSPLGSTLETCAALRIKRTTQRLEPEPLSKLDPYPFVLFPRS